MSSLRMWMLLTLLARMPAVKADPLSKPAFPLRGYYLTFMRMPTFGLEAWKQILDGIHADGGNLLILWVAGAFRSRLFPETWEYNRDHANIKHDFVRVLIDYAHARKIKVLLGFTPFGYDGVNRMPLTRPNWRATGPDGNPVPAFGIHCWGYNLCPARAETQAFMQAYVREMVFDFYPNADGLFIESSDYAACHCKECGARYYENEFQFVKALSGEVWQKDRNAMVVVYPHYFTGAEVPGLKVKAARQPFDSRWTVFFTPHSAHPDADLTAKANGAIWWDDAPALHTPSAIRDGARRGQQVGCTGYLPSLESYSFVATEAEEGQRYLVGKRQTPFGFGWLREGQMPYNELPIRVNRIAYREYSRNPDLSDADFRTLLGRELFGKAATAEAVEDVLALQAVFMTERTWCQAAPLASPERVRAMQEAGTLTQAKREAYRQSLDRVREIAERYQGKGKPFVELVRIARWLAEQWTGDTGKLPVP